METLTIMGQRLKALRKDAKKKQREMAELMGCTISNDQKIEYGIINIPTTSLAFLAEYFGVSADYLIGRIDNPKPWL